MAFISDKQAAVESDYAAHNEQQATNEVSNADHLVEGVSYGPTGVRGLISSPYVVGACFLASLGGFSFGYDQGVISIINTMHQFHTAIPGTKTPFGKGLMTGMLELGAFVATFMFPYLADKISRKRALTVVVVFFDIGAILQTAAVSYGMLVAGRFIGGMGVGTLALGAPIYISEIAPPNVRGSLLVLESISIVSGVVIAFWITYGTKDLVGDISFRLPLGLQMITATALGIFIHFFPYSPRWLAMVDRNEDCLDSLTKLRRLPSDDHRVQSEFKGIVAEVRFQNIIQERLHPGAKGFKREILSWLDLFRRKNWHRLAVGCGVCFFQQFSGINAFIYYAPTLFESIGQSPANALILSGVFNILQLVAVAVCFFIIDRVGRKPLAVFGGFGCAAAYVVITVLSALFGKDWSAHTSAGWACVAMAFIFILIFGVSYSPLGWALPPEVFPNSSRSKGVALCVALDWLSNFIVGTATPPMLASIGYGTYIFFAFWCFMAGVWAVFVVPETKGKTLEQMDEYFGDTSGRDEAAIMQEARRASVASVQAVSVHAESVHA